MKPKQQIKINPQKKEKLPQPFPVSTKLNFMFAVVCALAAIVLYANTLMHDYALDDSGAITLNQSVHQGIKGIPEIISTGMWHFENANLGYYRPLSMVTFAIENEFFPDNPQVSHLGNIILYGLTGFSLFLLLVHIFGSFHPAFSFIITLLFLAHPVHTEVVANIKSRDEMLSFLNLVIALLFFLKSFSAKANRQPEMINWKLQSVALLFFYLALISKETAMTGLLIAPLLLYFSGKNSIRQCLVKTIPFLSILILFQVQKYAMLGTVIASQRTDIVNYPYGIAHAEIPSSFLIFLWGIRLTLFPYPLSYDYAYNQIPAIQFSSPLALLGVVVAIATAWCGIRRFLKKTPDGLGVVLFCIMFAPAIAFVFLKGGIFAERFLYAPSLGFCIALTFLLITFSKAPMQTPGVTVKSIYKQWKLALPVAVIFFLYSFKTIDRNRVWKNNITLSSSGIITSPNSCQPYRHLANELTNLAITEPDTAKKKELCDKGISELRKALHINPRFADALVKMGDAFQISSGNYDSSLYYYSRAIEAAPSLALAYNNLGVLYENHQKQELASYYYNKAIEANPFFPDGEKNHERHKNLTGLDVKTITSGINSAVLEKDTVGKNAEFYYQLARNYASKGDYNSAIPHFARAVQMNPGLTGAYIDLSNCYALLGDYPKNIEMLNKLLAYEPNNLQALGNLVITYERMGKMDSANIYREKVKRIKGE